MGWRGVRGEVMDSAIGAAFGVGKWGQIMELMCVYWLLNLNCLVLINTIFRLQIIR